MNKTEEKQMGTGTSRRTFLKKAGTVALLTPPAMVLLSKPSSAKMIRSATAGDNSHHGYHKSKGHQHHAHTRRHEKHHGDKDAGHHGEGRGKK